MEGCAHYRTLPKEIERESEALGLKPVIQAPGDFVDGYVRLHVSQQEKKAKEESIRKQLSRKALLLDNVGVKRPRNHGDKKKSKKSWRPVTSKEKRKLKLYEIPEGARRVRLKTSSRTGIHLWGVSPELLTNSFSSLNQIRISYRFELYLPLHELWLQYMDELLQLSEHSCQVGVLQSKILKADLHGSHITVTRSKCPTYIGQSGIILMETQNTFKIIRKDNSVRVIPKAGSVFTLQFRDFVATLYGNHLRYKSADRSARKFKTRPTIDL